MAYEYTVAPIEMMTKERSFTLEVIDGKAPLSSTGLIDRRLFTGETKLNAVIEQDTSLWKLKYEVGHLPPALVAQRFTTFDLLKKFATLYFSKRNLKLTEVV